MRKFKIPNYDWKLVAILSKKNDLPALWERTTGRPGSFKNSITTLLKVEQQKRCAYCASLLYEDFPHRDHFAPKEKYPEWTFRPENIVLGCYACNTDIKKTYDPILIRKPKYRKCVFKIIHPFFDNPKKHIEFLGSTDGVLISSITEKGENTIRLFKLDSPDRTKQRAKDALFDAATSELHGRFLELFENVYLGNKSIRLVPK